MRYLIIPAACALALAACSKPTELASDENAAAEPAAAPAAEEAAPGPATDMDMAEMDHGDHDMSDMDHDMAAADAADDVSVAETPDSHTFHTYPDRTETVHLPVTEGETWSASIDNEALVSMGAASDETMPDGTVHHVVPFQTKASGNAIVTFERKAAGAAEASETRTIHFMIH